jgi:branched-chain amino acid transport system ATP-binding protein
MKAAFSPRGTLTVCPVITRFRKPTLEMSKMLLELKNVSSGYGKMHILEDVNLNIVAGRTSTILGPNGSGKTTLLNTIFGLANTFNGSITFDGRDITGLTTDKIASIGISYSPQVRNIFPNFTIEENMILGAYLRNDGDIKKDMEHMFKLFPEIERRRKNLAKTLSGGERQMLAVARALMINPKLLLLDEPTAGLAPIAAKIMANKIVEINEQGMTILLVEQNVNLSLEISDEGYVMVGGQVRIHDTAKNLRAREDLEQIYFK